MPRVTSARLVSDLSRGRRPWRARVPGGRAGQFCCAATAGFFHPACLEPWQACADGSAVTTRSGPALAEKIKALDEATGAGQGKRGRTNVAPTTTVSTVVSRHQEPEDEPTRWVRPCAGPGAVVGQGRRQRCPEHQGPAADQRARREADRIAGVPVVGPAQALPGADGRLVRVARAKTPYYMHAVDGEPLFMAGCGPPGTPRRAGGPTALLSCTIITTEAVGPLATIHDRMPLTISVGDWDHWLDPTRRPGSLRARRPTASRSGRSPPWSTAASATTALSSSKRSIPTPSRRELF